MKGSKVGYSLSPGDIFGPMTKFWTMSPADIFNPMLKWNPIYKYWTTSSGQYGLINIRHGETSNADVERDLVENVAGYGKQLGKLLDAVAVLSKHLGKNNKQIAKNDAVKALLELSEEIDKRKVALSRRNSLSLTTFFDDLSALKDKDEAAFEEFCNQLRAALAKQD